MEAKELLALGFKDTSSPEDEIFNDYTYSEPDFGINVFGNNLVDICVNGTWIAVPNCKTIFDIKDLIRLFGCNP